MKKLTQKQQDILTKMRAGAVAHYMPYMGRFNQSPYWFLSDTHERCTKQIKALIDAGLVKVTSHGIYNTPRKAQAVDIDDGQH